MGTLEVAKALCDRHVGTDLYSLQELNEICQNPDHHFVLVKKGNAYVGYFYAQNLLAKDIAQLSGVRFERIAALCQPQEEIGVCRSIGVDQMHRGSGLSDALLQHFTDYFFVDHGISLIVIPAWSKDGFVPAEKLLQRCGYHYLCDLPQPWADHPHLQCPHCQQPHCICDAVLYYQRR